MEQFAFNESAWRLSSFIIIFLIMAGVETLLPRRKRRHSRVVRWFGNFGILIADFATIAAFGFLVPIAAVSTAFFAQKIGFGLFVWLDWPVWLEYVLAFMALDFVIWFQHLITHKIPLLWRLHRVHHTDHDLDASSAVRFHPLEIIFSILFKSVFVLLLGAPAFIVFVFEAAVNGSALFNHANFKLPLAVDKYMRWLIVTPDMHRIHHSVIRAETDSNYGFGLSIWDRIFRTYCDQPKDGHEDMVLGLTPYQEDGPEKLSWILMLPFRK